jgi:hypothetical protein
MDWGKSQTLGLFDTKGLDLVEEVLALIIPSILQQLLGIKPNTDLPGCVLGVRTGVNDIPDTAAGTGGSIVGLMAKVSPDGSRCGGGRFSAPADFTHRRNSLNPFQNKGQHRTGNQKVNKILPNLLPMAHSNIIVEVMLLCVLLIGLNQFHPHYFEASHFETCKNLPDQTAPDRIWFYQTKSPFQPINFHFTTFPMIKWF